MGLFGKKSPQVESQLLFTRRIEFGDSGRGMTVNRIRDSNGHEEWTWRYDAGIDPQGIHTEDAMNIAINLLDLEYGFPITWPLYEREARRIFGERAKGPYELMVQDALEGRLPKDLVVDRLLGASKPIETDNMELLGIYAVGGALIEFRGEHEGTVRYMPAEEDTLDPTSSRPRVAPKADVTFLELPCPQDLLLDLYLEISPSPGLDDE